MSEAPSRAKKRSDGITPSIGAGVLAAMLVLVGCAFFLGRNDPEWSSQASFLVLPRREVGFDAMAGYYETLSRGQVVATFAELLRLQEFEKSAANRLSLDPASRKGLTVTVQVIPDTSIIRVKAASPMKRTAELVADEVRREAQDSISKLGQPYTVEIVTSGESATRSQLALIPLAAGAIGSAVAVGFAVQQSLLALMRVTRLRVVSHSDIGSSDGSAAARSRGETLHDRIETGLGTFFGDDKPRDNSSAVDGSRPAGDAVAPPGTPDRSHRRNGDGRED